MDADECRRRFHAAGGPLAAVVAMAEIWFRHASAITFHDPLAAALIFEESICQMRSVHVEVDLINANTLGHTYHHAGGGELPHFAAQAVDPGQFFDHYFGVVGG
jgi:purine nucleosidase